MKLGLSTAAFYAKYETEDAAEQMERFGVDCAEVFLQSDSEYDADFARLVRARLGSVPCTSVHPMGNHERFMARKPQRQKKDAFDVLRRVLDAGAALGAGVYVYHGLHTPLLKPIAWNLSWNVEAISEMSEEAEKRGMVIAWENVSWCQLTEPSRVLEAKEALPQVRFTLDIKQAMRAGCNPLDFVEAMGDRLCNVHLCDWGQDGKLCLPGEGMFDFDALFSSLIKVGYDGHVILEPYSNLVGDDEALKRSLAFLRGRMELARNNSCNLRSERLP